MQLEMEEYGVTACSCHRETLAELTESGSLMDTCSEKRTLGGLVRRRAFLAALMKADLGD